MQIQINGHLWLKPEGNDDFENVERLQDKCTFIHPAYKKAKDMGLATKGMEKEAKFWFEDDGWFGFPRAILDLPEVAPGAHIEDKRVVPKRHFAVQSSFIPRANQGPAVDDAVAATQAWPFGGVLQAQCGGGKTVMGVEIIRRIGTPTAVLVHKEFLARQWESEVRKFLPSARLGRIWRDEVCTGEDYDVVLCSVQSLLARDYGADVYGSFGMVMGDEVHRHGAVEWGKAVGKFPAKYRVGLTATPKRKDGLEQIVFASFGEIFHKMPEHRLPTRLAVRYLTYNVPPAKYIQPWNRKPNVAKLSNALVRIQSRTAEILDDIVQACHADRRILVLTDRLQHVDEMVRALALKRFDAARFVGGMTEKQQDKALKAQVVVATYPMAKEGLDVPRMDTLFLATPKGDVEQAVGRIQREHPEKKQPLVVDYVDKRVPLCASMFRSRTKQYRRLDLVRD